MPAVLPALLMLSGILFLSGGPAGMQGRCPALSCSRLLRGSQLGSCLARRDLCLLCRDGDAPAIPCAELPLPTREESAALGLWAGVRELCPVPCVERELLCHVQMLGAQSCCTWWGPEGHCSVLCPHRAASYPGASGTGEQPPLLQPVL